MTQAEISREAAPRAPLRRRLLAPAGVLAGVSAAVTYVATIDPNASGNYPTCPLLWFSGAYCPGCGALRMTHALAHGDVPTAFGLNPLLFILLPFFGYLWVRWVACTVRGEPMSSRLLAPKVVYVLLGVVAVYWVLRNLPFAQALAP